MKIFLLATACLLFSLTLHAQPIDQNHPTYPHAKVALQTLKGLLALPNDAHYPEEIERNVQWCEGAFQEYGFKVKRLETESVPLLLAVSEEETEGQPTVLYYFHIDGQPVDRSFWFQEDPYQATLKEEQEGEGWVQMEWNRLQEEVLDPEWRIFARSASDDKAPFVMWLAALETLREQGRQLPYNLKVILDFEEEIGSPNLAQAVKDYQADLAADMLLIFDGPKHVSNRPTISFGARGITTFSLRVFGPTFPLHSGHYGNYAPNPAQRLAELLTSMKDSKGRVTIPGFYDGIRLDDQTKEILSQVPDNEQELMVRLGIGETDKVGNNYQESLQYPSLNVRGMSSAWVGKETRTIVPASALAEVDIRLVVESDGNRLLRLVREHIEKQGYYITEDKPTSRERIEHPKICQFEASSEVTAAFRTELDSELGTWVYEAFKKTFGEEPIRIRTMGGTLPISPFITTLDVPAIIIPLVNSDNNQHSPNENLRLGNYFDGVKAMYGLLGSGF